jgi:hypothetical protein
MLKWCFLFLVASATRRVDMTVVGSLAGPGSQSGGALLQIAPSHSWTGDVLWIAAFKGGVWSVDVTDPTQPTHLGFWFAPQDSSVYSVVVDPAGRYAYLALSGQAGSLVVLDISNPVSPFQVGGCERSIGQAQQLLLWPERHWLFVATGNGGVGIYDTADINNNTQVAHSPCYPPYPGTDPRLATIPAAAAVDLALLSNATSSLLFVASHGEGLLAVDFTGPSAQGKVVGTVSGTQQATAVAAPGGTAHDSASVFVTAGAAGLTAVDLARLQPTASLAFNSSSPGVLQANRVTSSADGTVAFVSVVGAGGAADKGSVLAVSASADRTGLSVAGSIELEGVGGTALSADGKFLYAADGTRGLRIVRIG